ncbi:hypothetical protein [Streptomyces sp. NPDC088789]|uniref:hypothetical protein n=1 Tax=Streptomyces sp. NPDC088789 TaxID=3365899 RepID=UPI00382B76CC
MVQKTAVKTISVRETLTQDVVLSRRVRPVKDSFHPVAGFENVFAEKGTAYRQGRAEEAVVVSDKGELLHVRRDQASPTGWSDARIGDDTWGKVSEAVVVAGRRKETGKTLYSLTCLFIAGEADSWGLYWSRLKDDGTTWTPRGKCVTGDGADVVPAAGIRVTSLQRKARIEGDAAVVIDGTNLYCFGGEDAELDAEGKPKDLKAAYTPFSGVAGLNSTDLSYSIAALGETAATVRGKNGVALLFRPSAPVDTGPAVYWMGMAATDKPKGVHPYEKDKKPVRALAAFSWGDRHVFLLENKDGTFTAWACDGRGNRGEYTALLVATGTKLRQVHLRLHGSDDQPQWDLYWLDDKGNILLSRHARVEPFDPAAMPRWWAARPLDRVSAGLGVPSILTGPRSVFFNATTAEELELSVQDKLTGSWSKVETLLPDAAAEEVTRYRVEVLALSAAGTPVPGAKLDLGVTPGSGSGELTWECPSDPDAAGLKAWGDHLNHVTRRTPVFLVTDGTGRIVLTLSAGHQLAGPRFSVSCTNDDQTTATTTFQPGTSVHTYFLGGTSLHPANPGGGRKPFTGTELQTLLKDVKDEDAVKHAAVITDYAKRGLGKTPEKDCIGTFYSVAADGAVQFREFTSREELAAFHGRAFPQRPDDVLLSPDDEIEDVLLGLERGTYTIVSSGTVLLDSEEDTSLLPVFGLALLVKGLTEATKAISLVVNDIRRAGQLIMGVLQTAGAAARDVVEWLRAVFDFSDIWKDKKSIESGLTRFFGQTETELDAWKAQTDTWVRQCVGTVKRTKEEAEKEQKPYFGDLVTKLGTTTMQEARNKGEGQNSHLAAATTETSHQWLVGKIRSTPGKMPAITPTELDGPPKVLSKDFTTEIGTTASTALTSLATFLGDSAVADKPLSDLVTTGKDLSLALANDAKTVVTYLFPYLKTAMKTAKAYLDEDLSKDWPLLGALWDWVAKKAGSEGDKFTVGGLLALATAFPGTVLVKAVDGHQATLFNGQLFSSEVQGQAGTGDEPTIPAAPSLQDLEKWAAYLTIGQGFLMASADLWTFWAKATPRWLTALCCIPGALIGVFTAISVVNKHKQFRWEHLGPIAVLLGCLISLGGVFSTDPAYEQVGPIWGSLCGGLALEGAIAASMTGDITGIEAIMGSIIGTFPPLATALGVDALKLAGSIGARLYIDLFGNICSGLLLLPKQ